MDKHDYGKSATCGVNGQNVIVSKYNCKCPCLNCVGCNKDQESQQQCPWHHVMEADPCTNEDIREIMCVNCIKAEQQR